LADPVCAGHNFHLWTFQYLDFRVVGHFKAVFGKKAAGVRPQARHDALVAPRARHDLAPQNVFGNLLLNHLAPPPN
jgi:hypothetical protein